MVHRVLVRPPAYDDATASRRIGVLPRRRGGVVPSRRRGVMRPSRRVLEARIREQTRRASEAFAVFPGDGGAEANAIGSPAAGRSACFDATALWRVGAAAPGCRGVLRLRLHDAVAHRRLGAPNDAHGKGLPQASAGHRTYRHHDAFVRGRHGAASPRLPVVPPLRLHDAMASRQGSPPYDAAAFRAPSARRLDNRLTGRPLEGPEARWGGVQWPPSTRDLACSTATGLRPREGGCHVADHPNPHPSMPLLLLGRDGWRGYCDECASLLVKLDDLQRPPGPECPPTDLACRGCGRTIVAEKPRTGPRSLGR